MHSNNKLINNYQQSQPKVQNNLLQRNQLFMNNMNTTSAQTLHAQQMQQMYQVKQTQHIVDKDKIKEILIKPIKLDKGNKLMFDKSLKEKEEQYKPKLEEYWKKKTNVPYKGILKNQPQNMKITTEKDLVVHKVTLEDKNAEEIDNKYQEINEKIQSHNGELKKIYSTSKKGEHKKNFEYTHIYQYRKPELNDEDDKEQDHEKLKQDRFTYYKEQQKQQEKNKNKFDELLEKLVSDGTFSPDELSGFDTGSKNTINNDNKDDQVDTKNINKKQLYLDRKKARQ